MPKQLFSHQTVGILWFVLHCLLFAIISVISKILITDIHISQILFLQTSMGCLILLPIILKFSKDEITAVTYKIHFYRAFFWACASALFFYSTTVIPIPKAIAISFAVPLFTTIMAIIFLKEDLHKYRIASLIAGFVGMLIIIRPGYESFEIVSLLVVVASFMWSMTDIMIKLLSKTHNAMVNTFLFALFSVIFTMPFAVYYWHAVTLSQMLLLMVLSGLFVINIYSVTKAYEKAELTIMMPFTFSQLIFSAILAYFIFDNLITAPTLIGSAIIITSTSYIAYRERKAHGKFLAPEIAEEIYDVDIEKL